MPNLVTRIAIINNFDVFLDENIFCCFKTVTEKAKIDFFTSACASCAKAHNYVEINGDI